MNYWIFQSNPRRFPIIQEIRNAFSEKLPVGYQLSYWHIKKVPKRMRPDDIIFIWKSDGDDKGTRGIYAKARVISVWPHHKEPLTPDIIDAVLKEAGTYLDWYDPNAEAQKEARPTVIIQYTKHLLAAPLLVHKIAKVPELEMLLILRFFQKTLYDDLTEDQGRILDKMTGGSEAGLAMKETKSESHKTDHDHLKEMLYEIGHVIRITDSTWDRLKRWAVPLEDTTEDAVRKVLDAAEEHMKCRHATVSPNLIHVTTTKIERKGKLTKGLKTPPQAYRRPILEALYELGGRASVQDVLKTVEQKVKSLLTEFDYQRLPSGIDTRWRNTAQWERLALVKDGLLKADSPSGIWELSNKGEQEVKSRRKE